MITQFQVDEFLRKALIALDHQQSAAQTAPRTARKAIETFSEFTRSELTTNHKRTVRKCFKLAERLCAHGDVVVRMLMENLYVYYLSVCLPRDHQRMARWVKMMPPHIHRIFFKQQLSSGC